MASYIFRLLFGWKNRSFNRHCSSVEHSSMSCTLYSAGGKCSQQTELSGENINITWTQLAVGNRDDEITILDVRKFKALHKHKFNYEDKLLVAKSTRAFQIEDVCL